MESLLDQGEAAFVKLSLDGEQEFVDVESAISVGVVSVEESGDVLLRNSNSEVFDGLAEFLLGNGT